MRPSLPHRLPMAALCAGAVIAGCQMSSAPSANPTREVSAHASALASPRGGEVVLAAGDIGACDSTGDEATAELLDGMDGTILALGDLAYPDGTVRDFDSCYQTSWGRHRDRTRPIPGNHEYESDAAVPDFWYFGDAAAIRARAGTPSTWAPGISSR